MRSPFVIFFCLIASALFGQPKAQVEICFKPTFGGKPLVMEDQTYFFPNGDSVVFAVFRFYISNIALYTNDKKEVESKTPVLFDLSANKPLVCHVRKPAQYNTLRFNLGIDSLTNVSGALGGDLDPSKGMYWTWQSGYINLKLEGTTNRCPARNNQFVFHLGGYSGVNNALQTISLNVSNKNTIYVGIPIDVFLEGLDLSKQNAVMIPGKEACVFSKMFALLFMLLPE